jgi:hypothetical protein
VYVEASIRPWFTTGVALVGAGAIALTPITPMAPSSPSLGVHGVAAALSREFQLTALDIPYILSLPIVRQFIRNEVENIAVYLGGFAKAGVGLAQSVLSIPGVTVEAIQQVLALDFVGAFDTVTAAIRDSVIAVGQPLLDSLIWRNQKYYVVQAALRAAVPQALIDVTNGFLQAGSVVATSLIVGTQDLVAAILSLDLGNIINAALGGTKNFVAALGEGAGAIVDGIEAAQLGIATALATPPPPPPTFGEVADVSALSTFSVDNTVSLSRSSKVAALDSVRPTQGEPPSEAEVSGVVDTAEAEAVDPLMQDAKTVGADVVGTPAKAESEAPAATDPAPASDPSDEATTPAGALKKKPGTPVKDALKVDEKAAGVESDQGVDKDAGKKAAGTDAKPASDGGGE